MPAREFEAYRAELVVEKLPARRVESLCWWQGTLLVGLQDGAIQLYRQVPDPVEGTRSWQVRKGSRPGQHLAVDDCRKRPAAMRVRRTRRFGAEMDAPLGHHLTKDTTHNLVVGAVGCM